MPSNRLLLAGLVLVAASGVAEARPTFVAERVVRSGQTQKVAFFSAIDPTCQSMGPMTINMVDGPRSGQIQIGQGREYPSFGTLNTRARCNTRKLPATQVFYTAAPGFVGEDEFTIEVVGPLGAVQNWRMRVAVR